MIKTTGLKRDNNEQYYTKEQVAEYCVNLTNRQFKLNTFDLIIEPSAGTGSFIKALDKQNVSKNVISYDIEPKYESTIKQDYLSTQVETEKNVLVIGNPPFGRQSSLAKKFIKHSCKFANVIAFILPKSFKKSSMINCFDSHFHKVFEVNLEENSFIFNEKEYSVPCVFQIWEKQTHPRDILPKLKENEVYEVTKDVSNANIAFRRVGVYAGRFIYDNLETLSKESHYFMKLTISLNDTIRKQLDTIEWTQDNTIGPKSISKQELISKLNQILN